MMTEHREVRTNESGQFVLEHVGKGKFMLNVGESEMRLEMSGTVVEVDGVSDKTGLELSLKKGELPNPTGQKALKHGFGMIGGIVLDPDGQPYSAKQN